MQKEFATTEDDSDSPPSYHPSFSHPEADVILRAKDGTLFRVHSYTLKTTSGWFRTMFSLPQAGSESHQRLSMPRSAETLYLDEDSATLEALLSMICGLSIPALQSNDLLERVLYAAEKYDTPGPLSLIRALLMPKAILDDPLHLYVMACRYGWEDEIRAASTKTLTLNLFAPEHKATLRKLSTHALLALLDLHHSRRELLRKQLDAPPFVNDSGPGSCSHCNAEVDYRTWRELKYVIMREMELRPLGDTVLEAGLNDWPAAKTCWAAQCPECGRVLYDKQETLRAIEQCIEALPLGVR
ncbi:hypothetical protein K474DRAFT_574350 [Panus rudis PR-1116 ss-1]|nr:hypothetical protein K474DRAFT_574350 [Panus rudis PR-1116 ss-1]